MKTRTTALYFIQCLAPGWVRFQLLATDGTLTCRRVYAARMPVDPVDGCLAELRNLNPCWVFSSVCVAPLRRRRTSRGLKFN